jgi:hypothetical protein
MATRDKLLIGEWLKYGKVIYENRGVMVIEGGEEFLICVNQNLVHITKDRILAKVNGKRFIATIPLRGRPRGMEAIRVARAVMSAMPPEVVLRIEHTLPWLALVARV